MKNSKYHVQANLYIVYLHLPRNTAPFGGFSINVMFASRDR